MLRTNLKPNRFGPRQSRRKRGAAMRCALLVLFSCVAGAQEPKHMMTVAANGEWPTTLTAFEIERVGQYPSVVHLKGAVEI